MWRNDERTNAQAAGDPGAGTGDRDYRGGAGSSHRPTIRSGAPDQQALAQVDEAIDEDGNGLANCVGGAQEGSLARMNDLPTTLAENANFQTLPGSVVNFTTPMNDVDQIMVTFSAEARLRGQPVTYTTPVDFLHRRR